MVPLLPPVAGIAAFLLDLDGTLVETEPLHWQTALDVLAGFGVDRDDPTLYPGPGWNEAEFWTSMRARFAIGPDAGQLAELRTAALERALAERPIEPARGARELLEALAARGLPQLVVSASPRAQIGPLLAAAGLDRHVAGWVSGHDDVPRSKPWPDPYLEGARRLGVDPRACVAIEDSPTGLRSALAAGLFVVVVPAPDADPAALTAAHAQAASLLDVVAALDPAADRGAQPAPSRS